MDSYPKGHVTSPTKNGRKPFAILSGFPRGTGAPLGWRQGKEAQEVQPGEDSIERSHSKLPVSEGGLQ